MRRLLLPLSALAAAVAIPLPATASGDFGCSPSWRLRHANLSGCDDMAMLGPGNDTRTNLAFLLLDRRGQVPQPGKSPNPVEPLPALFDWRTLAGWLAPRADDSDSAWGSGEGSRCRTNDSGAQAFAAAVNAAKLPGGEGAALIAARNGLKPDCQKLSDGAAAVADLAGQVKSPAGRDFAAYVAGAETFYDGDFAAAANRFASLKGTSNAWLRETARYMAARVEVNRIQVGLFDEYGNMKGKDAVDRQAVTAADAGLRSYIKDYPQGLYTASARGLLRRVYWFGGMRDQLAAQYVSLFGLAPAARGFDDIDLAEEMDTKLLPDLTTGDTTDPTLLAVVDLKRMRVAENEVDAGCCGSPLSLADLESQRGSFAKDSALYDYLLAAHAFYLQKKPADVLRIIPDAAKQPRFTAVQFSRQMLRGMALEAVKDRNTRGFWLEMFPGATLPTQHSALELALAWHDERTGAVGKVFAADSPVDDAAIREILLINVADAALLRQQAKGAKVPHEREVALFTLLYKELSRGAYRDFIADLALVPADAATDTNFYDLVGVDHAPTGLFKKAAEQDDDDCPGLRKLATRLAAAPADWHAQICLADFFRDHGFDQISIDTQPAKEDLGGTPTLFAGPVYSRLEVYRKVIAAPGASADDKAYALFRAINCYAPSGNNSCGGIDAPKTERKSWFTRLKTAYPKSRWATELRYYW